MQLKKTLYRIVNCNNYRMIDSLTSFFQFNPEDESDTRRLQKLFDVSRVIMKAKNESCEEIMEEFEKEVKANVKQSRSRSLQKKLSLNCFSFSNSGMLDNT